MARFTPSRRIQRMIFRWSTEVSQRVEDILLDASKPEVKVATVGIHDQDVQKVCVDRYDGDAGGNDQRDSDIA